MKEIRRSSEFIQWLKGPGYRVYYKDTGREIIVLLCGGDKTTQDRDIERAKKIARLYEEE
jgi:putative addiction module killer protein